MVCDIKNNFYNDDEECFKMTQRVLCATMNLLKIVYGSYEKAYELLDYKEAGVDKEEFIKWHKNHLANDLRNAALTKLTREERVALGLEL